MKSLTKYIPIDICKFIIEPYLNPWKDKFNICLSELMEDQWKCLNCKKFQSGGLYCINSITSSPSLCDLCIFDGINAPSLPGMIMGYVSDNQCIMSFIETMTNN